MCVAKTKEDQLLLIVFPSVAETKVLVMKHY